MFEEEGKHTISIKDVIAHLPHYSLAVVPVSGSVFLFKIKTCLDKGLFLDSQLSLVWFCVISYLKTSGVTFNSCRSCPDVSCWQIKKVLTTRGHQDQ